MEEPRTVSAVAWIVVGLVVWVTLAAIVAVLIGRAIRLRDRQVPRPPVDAPGSPEPRPDRRDRG